MNTYDEKIQLADMTHQRDMYKAEVSNVLGLMNIVCDERDRYRKALTTILTDPDGMLCEHWDVAFAALEGPE